jgi:acyl-coenzyme A synthetase/AMP-(fatty) acid ligase
MCQLAAEYEATILSMTTTLFHLLVDEFVRTSRHLPESVRAIVIGGEAYDPQRLEA